MTDASAYPPLPEPAAHMLTEDLEMFKTREVAATAYSVAVSTPGNGRSEPLFTAQQMREYRDAPAWLPIETAPQTSKARLIWVPENKCQFMVSWNGTPRTDYETPGWSIFGGGWREYLQRATLWQPLPDAPSEQTGEKP